MRIIVRSLLPLGEGILLDPFMGSGSTIAAAAAVGYTALEIEIDQHYYESALEIIPKLAALYPDFKTLKAIGLNGCLKQTIRRLL